MIFRFLSTRRFRADFLLLLSLLFVTGISFGQGSENFTNLPTGTPGSYLSRSWTGTDGVVWNATSARTDQTLTTKAICTDASGTVTSPSYTGGMGTLQFNYVRAFTGTSARTIKVYVNGVQQGSDIVVSPSSNTVVGYSANINISGNVVLELRTSGAQIKIDDIQWTTFASCTAPATQSSSLTFPSTTNNSTTFSWTSGLGDGRIVVMKEASVVAGTPTSGTSYTANAAFGTLGSTIAANEYVVYNGTGSTVSVTGLKCNTTYHVKVFEYNTTGTCYNTTSPPAQSTTTLSPSITATPTSLSGFTYVFGSGTSATQTYSLSAANLNPASGNITVTPSGSNYEVSTDGTTFFANLSVPYTAGSLSSTTIHVRLKAGLAVNGSYASTITNTYTPTASTNCASSSTVTLSGSVTAPTPNIVLNSSNPTVVAGNITMPSTNNVIYGFNLAVSVYQAVLSGVTINTSGTYAASNITNFKCWYSADATFGGDVLLSTKTTSLQPGNHVFPSFSNQTIASGATGYIFITADIPCTTAGNTITVSAISTADVTFTSGNKSGTAFAGGTKTFVDGAVNSVTSPATSNCVSGGTTVSWTLPTGCSDNILVFAKAAGSFSATPTGNGSLYNANTIFGSGTSFDSGFCVYEGTGTSVNITGLTNGVNYTFIIYNRLGTNWSSGVTVNCTPTIAYCTPTYTTGTATNDWFSNVTLGTLNHTSPKSSSPFYTFYNSVTIPDIIQGATADVSVTLANDANQYVGIWIDFNQDGTFDASEGLVSGNAGSGGTVTLNFAVPAGATVGNTRMRVRGGNDAVLTTSQACGASSSAYGETKDYIVNIVASCTPTATISSFMPTSGPAATLVTITGSGFTGATGVKFGTTNATSFTVINSTTIIAEVPSGISASVQISVLDATSCATISGSTFSFISLTGSCTVYATDLFISEVFDSETGNNHYIELYNFTGATINLATPNQYNLLINNTTNADLTGTLAHGATLVVYCGADGPNIANSAASLGSGFNEDDSLRLRKNGVTIDKVMAPNYVGYSIIRNSNVFSPTASYSASEWVTSNHSISTFVPTIGSHTISSTSVPIITSSPLDVSACSLTMSVTSSTPGVTYQWKFNDPATMNGWLNVNITNIPVVSISGATTATLTITGDVSALLDFQFYCQVTESGCSNTSNSAQFEYNSRPIYRSKAAVNGNWSDFNNWEMSYDGTTYINACVYPRAINSSEAIIQSGTRVVLDLTTDEIEIDKLTIEANGELEMLPNARLTVFDSTASGADLIVNGTLTDRNNSANTIELSGSATWILGASGTMVRTNTAGIGQYKDQYQGGMSSIPAMANWIFRYNGDGNPTVGSVDFYYPNLTFENTANAGLFDFNSGLMVFTGSTGMTTVKGNLNIGTTGSGQVSIHNNNTYASPLLIHGNATIAVGSSLTNLATTAGTGFELKGSLTVNGTLDVLSGSTERVLKLTGTTDQTVSGTGTINLYKLTVNKSAGKVILNRNLQVQNELVMTEGHIYTGTNLLELGLSIAQKGTLDYNLATADYVVGKMRRWFNGTNSGNASGLFPMGYDEGGLKNRHTKVEYTSAPTAGGHLTVEFIPTAMGTAGLTILAANTGGFGFDVVTTENQGYWKIDNQAVTLTDGAYTIACTGEGFTTINSLTGITLLKRVGGGNWLAPATHIAASGSVGVPTVSRSSMVGWSNFGFGGNSANPLPVELISFSARCENGNVLSQWSTASEKNSDYFILQSSVNMENWRDVSVIPGAGNSSTQQDYSATDWMATGGISYYRLVQVDFDGNIEFFSPISVNCSDADSEFLKVYPNPTAGDFTVEWNMESISGNVTIGITSSTGALITEKLVNVSKGKHMVPFSETLASGVYYVTLKSEDGAETLKLVVK